jgi:YbbR domain-containing protein
MSSLNSRKLLARVVEKWPAKVLSVAAALILFVFHRMNTLESRFFSVPLRVETSAALVPISSYPRLVRVSLRGDANSIYPIVEDDIEAYIDLTKHTEPGWYRAAVQIRKMGSAVGVEPLEISVDPLEISLQLDQKISKTVPLIPNVRGNAALGFDLVSHSLSPAQVTVEGPRSVLGSVSDMSTEAVDLEGKNDDFTVMAAIVNPNPFVVIRGGGTAEFRGLIRPAVPAMNIDGIPIIVKGLDQRFEADAGYRTGSVRLEGSQDMLDMFVPSPDFLSVDCSALHAPGTYTLPVTIDLPNGLVPLRREPMELNLTVTLRGSEAQ